MAQHPPIILREVAKNQTSDQLVSSTAQSGSSFAFIDLFAGIGGFHWALENLGAQCVFASEFDAAARKTYRLNFSRRSPHLFANKDQFFNWDITEVTQPKTKPKNQEALYEHIRGKIPAFDVLCAGFPCQPFSQAGHKLGFDDERGNLFFDIEKILKARRPKAIFLENVRNLLKHDNENTIKVIRRKLKAAGYGDVMEFVVKASDYGVPQHRPRVFIVGFHEEVSAARKIFEKPKAMELSQTMSDIFGGEVTNLDGNARLIGYTLRVGGKSSPITDRRNWDGYIVNGELRRLGPREGIKMQGFPKTFAFPKELSHADKMKQLGNSVAVPAVQAFADAIFKALRAAAT
jgi:DNA (cytosine-5)-methyltransferase 1